MVASLQISLGTPSTVPNLNFTSTACASVQEVRGVPSSLRQNAHRNPRMDFVIVLCDVCKFLRHGLSSGFYGHPVYSLIDLSELYIRSYLMMAAQYPCFAIYSLSLTSCSYRKASGNLTFWRSEALSKQKSFQFLPFYTSLLKMYNARSIVDKYWLPLIRNQLILLIMDTRCFVYHQNCYPC